MNHYTSRFSRDTAYHIGARRSLIAGRVRHTTSYDVLLVVLVGLALCVYCINTADRELFREAGAALMSQIVTWAACVAMTVMRTPSGRLRVSDPTVVALALGAIYLVYPSIVWCQGEPLPFRTEISSQSASYLFELHSLFFVGLTAGYAVATPRHVREVVIEMATLPTPWLLFAVGVLPAILSAGGRLLNGESLISAVAYSSEWSQTMSRVGDARVSGGLSYLFVQLIGKTFFYPIVSLGLAWGLLWSRTAGRTILARLAPISLIGASAAVVLFLGNGSRSPAIISGLIALVLLDLLSGKSEWRMILPLGAATLGCFYVLGYYRVHRDLGLTDALERGYQEYRVSDASQAAAEFTCMLEKEALMIDIARDTGYEWATYVTRNVLAIVPSQLVPAKATWVITRDLLSARFLGKSAEGGASGVAGTTVGDGYRFGGPIGVFLLAGLFGMIFGGARIWALTSMPAHSGPVLLRVAIFSGFAGFTYLFIRSDLAEVLICVVYLILIPWAVFGFVLRSRSAWLSSAPLRAAGRRNQL